MGIKVEQEDLNIVLLQEHWTNKRKSKIVKGGCIYSTNNDPENKSRAGIWVDDVTNEASKCFKLEQLCDLDSATIKCKFKLGDNNKEILISSMYMPGFKTTHETMPDGSTKHTNSRISNPITDKLLEICNYAKTNNMSLIIGCDANAKSRLWGSEIEDDRGRNLVEFLVSQDLYIINTGKEPTFVQGSKRSIIDLTIVSRDLLDEVTKWRVDKSVSGSDHRYILFELSHDTQCHQQVRNKRKTNWKKYKELTGMSLKKLNLTLTCHNECDKAADAVNEILIEAYEKCCKGKKAKVIFRQDWYSDKLQEMRIINNKKHKAMNKAFKENSENFTRLKIEYDEYCKLYKKACRKAKTSNWRGNMEKLDKLKDVARIQKFFENGRNPMTGSLLKNDGSYTENWEETANLLMKTHFPNCITISELERISDTPNGINNEEFKREIEDLIDKDKVEWAINSFGSYKSGGVDGIFPALLQKADKSLIDILVALFRYSVTKNYIPRVWRGTFVTFIPKPGKISYDRAKSFRPISLMSFTLKTLEKIIDLKIRSDALVKNPLHKQQFAYSPGKSTETALHSLVSHLEDSVENDGMAITAFIDIESAFDGCKFEVIEEAARKKGVQEWVINWFNSMLHTRDMKALKDSDSWHRPTQGIPQGGTGSPGLWNMVVDSLIERLTERTDLFMNIQRVQAHVSGFADDLSITLRGKKKNRNTIIDNTNKAMRIVEKWCEEVELSVNPEKAVAMMFTKDKTEWGDKKIKIFGKDIEWVSEFKYLGVILDSNLKWNRHINNAIDKGRKTLFAARAIVGKTWGITPAIMKWIFEQIVVARVCYGCLVWWRASEKAVIRSKLLSLQRTAMLMITGAMRTTPTYAMMNLVGLCPLDIKIQTRAARACLGTMQNNHWKPSSNKNSHTKIENVLKESLGDTDIDYLANTWNVIRNYSTETKEKDRWDQNVNVCTNNNCWFVDASKNKEGAGIGIVNVVRNISLTYRLNDMCDINQAEITAIRKCADYIKEHITLNGKIIIFTDSTTAIRRISNPSYSEKTTKDCVRSLNELGEAVELKIAWVPSNCKIKGNMMADRAAKAGSRKLDVDLKLSMSPKLMMKLMEEEEVEFCNKRWNEEKAKLKEVGGYIGNYDLIKSKKLLKMRRLDIRVIVGLASGHGCCNKYLSKINRADSSACRFCDSGDDETIRHWMKCEGLKELYEESVGKTNIDGETFKELKFTEIVKLAKKCEIYSVINFF